MAVKRFFATTSREALSMVRSELGPDATIISNRSVDGWNEILAMGSDDMESLIAEKDVPFETVGQTPPGVAMPNKVVLNKVPPVVQKLKDEGVGVAAPTFRAAAELPDIKAVISEIRQMRDKFEAQLDVITTATKPQPESQKKALFKAMRAVNFSVDFSRQILEKLANNLSYEDAMKWVRSVVSHNLISMTNESALIYEGGIFALVGPTGVGKTTTLAKLAARIVMKNGALPLALITTDAYRIGGYEQLRIYGKILGVTVVSVKDAADLKLALAQFKNKHTILIDTMGVGQRDKMVEAQLAMLNYPNSKIKKILCFNATNTIETLNDVANSYLRYGLDGCIITKIDEAVTLGGVLDVVIQKKLRVLYVTNGQRVPEDIQLVDTDVLVNSAFVDNTQVANRPEHTHEDTPFVLNTNGLTKMAAAISHV